MFAAAIVACPCCTASAQEHLEPERGSINESLTSLDYKLRLHKALLKEAASYYRARVICEPAFQRRWVVTLVCEQADTPVYFVDYAGLADPRDPRAGGQKARAPLDREAADAIQNVWLQMLRAVRYPDAPRIGADGVTYHFSRFVGLGEDDPRAPGGWETGQVWTPDPTSLTGRLASLGEAMREFAMAPQEKRADLREKILKEAIGLRSDLDKHPKPGERMP
jgi:hypothetical protein